MPGIKAGTKVQHDDKDIVGVVVRVLSNTYVSVQWHDGTRSDEHVADLSIVRPER